MKSKHNYFVYGISSTMKILLFLFLLLLLPNIVNASSYDFDLKANGDYRAGLDRCLKIDNIQVRNGSIEYRLNYKHPTDSTKQYKGVSTFDMLGRYSPEDNILKGGMEELIAKSEVKYTSKRCRFYSTEITGETKEITIFFNDCVKDDIDKGEMIEEKIEYGPFEFWVQNSNIEETKSKLEDSGTRFSDISGSVEILLPTGYEDDGTPIFEDEENWQFAKLDMELPYGAKIKLKEKSSIILSFPSSEPYEMKTPENLYPYDEATIILPLKPQKQNQFKLLGGMLYNNFKKAIIEGTMDIEMSQAVAGIKGTTFILEEDGTNSKLKVIEGVVNFTPKNGGESRDIVAGEEVVATKTGLSEIKTFDIAAEKNSWTLDTLSKNNQALAGKTIIIGGIIIFAVVIGLIVMLKKKIK